MAKKTTSKKTTRKKTARKKTATKRTVRRKKTTARRGRPPALMSTSTSALMAELARREQQLESLVAKRDACASELDELNAEIEALSGVAPRPAAKRGRPAGRKATGRRKVGRPASRKGTASRTAAGKPRKRPHNETTLEEAMAKVLKGVTMGVTEIAEAVQKAGYKTSAANFRTIVNQTLIRSKAFKKVARGKYTAA